MKNLVAKVDLLPEDINERVGCSLLFYDDGTYTSSLEAETLSHWKIENGLLHWKRSYEHDWHIITKEDSVKMYFDMANKIIANITNALEFNKHVLGEDSESR